jgi:hypothetical protein
MKIKHNTPVGGGLASSNNPAPTANSNTSTGGFNFNINIITSSNTTATTTTTSDSSHADSTNPNSNQSILHNFAPPRSTSVNLLSGQNEDSLSPSSFNINQIQTRSAANRAAAQHQQHQHKPNHANSSLKRHPQSHYTHHHNHQHIIGKIVKPIPVRPMSSSSSSSTHSSSFSTAAHHALNSNRHYLDGSETANNTQQQQQQQNGNFSLIAKYFASFPATRLKAQSPVHHQQRQNTNPQASTPFLPFKKSQISKTHIFSPVVAAATATATASASAAQPNSSYLQSEYHIEPEGIQFNLRSSSHNHNHFALHNTDHLCTNFKRMIKLNDFNNAHTEDTAVGSPHTAASNTPTGLLDSDSCDHATSSSVSNHSHGEHVSNNSNFMASYINNTDGLLSTSAATAAAILHENSQQQQPIFGQITMETRSTRKFLIKHHPYLQMNNANMINNNKQPVQQQMRPSINLIKMKKMIYNEASSPVLNRNSRSCSSSQWDQNIDQKLVKFTDIAPSPGYTTSLRIKNQQMINANAKRRQNVTLNSKFQTPNTLKTRKSSTSSNSAAVDSALTSSPGTNNKLENDWRCFNDLETFYNNNNNNDEEDIDDSQEDSSGYYSSYHSVDLISSSGGSSGGDLSKQHHQSKAPVNNMNLFGLNKSTAKTTVSTQVETSINSPNADSSSSSSSMKPHHHYHTRYLSNYLQQNHTFSTNTTDLTSQRNRSTTPTVKQNSTNHTTTTSTSINTNNTPTTRLRYQQQLAAAAAATSLSNNMLKSSSLLKQQQLHQLEIDSACDLDLDQIEND